MIRAFGRMLVDCSFTWDGWWIFDRKGYRHHYMVAASIVRAPDGLQALSMMLGPVRFTIGRIRAHDQTDGVLS